jgi:hypothetical protein
MRREDISGRKYGRWFVVSYSHNVKKNIYWLCRCECGTERAVTGKSLVWRQSLSCGCLRDELASRKSATHRQSKTIFYRIWKGMHNRCNDKTLPYYGGKGIKVCERWADFENFRIDMFDSWKLGLSIERKDNDKGYSPENCCWIPRCDQAKNKGNNTWLDTPWGRMILADAARKMKVSATTLIRRRQKFPPEKWFLPPRRVSL